MSDPTRTTYRVYRVTREETEVTLPSDATTEQIVAAAEQNPDWIVAATFGDHEIVEVKIS